MRHLVIGILVLTLLSGHAIAHTPSGVDVSYDEQAGDLGVAITHQVDDTSTHYVKQVTVRQGTTVLVSQSYTSQPGKSAFTYRYNLPQLKEKSGEITVDVECNVFGTRRDNHACRSNCCRSPCRYNSRSHPGAGMYFYCSRRISAGCNSYYAMNHEHTDGKNYSC